VVVNVTISALKVKLMISMGNLLTLFISIFDLIFQYRSNLIPIKKNKICKHIKIPSEISKGIQFRIFYLKVKLKGTVTLTGTALPVCFPGFQLGIDLITRAASLSHSPQPGTPLANLTSVISPLGDTTKL
jgi:hypothetical protein